MDLDINFKEYLRLNEKPIQIEPTTIRTPKSAFADVLYVSEIVNIDIGLPKGYELRETVFDNGTNIYYFIIDSKTKNIEFIARHDKIYNLKNTYEQVLINKYNSNISNLTYKLLTYTLKKYNIISDDEQTIDSNKMWLSILSKFFNTNELGIYNIKTNSFEKLTSKSNINNIINNNFSKIKGVGYENMRYYIKKK